MLESSQSADSKRFADTGTTLKIIDAVENDGAASQRALAKETGVALGLANAYLKRCIRKGWIKAREAPARRYLYYVTPMGFAEKARLTAEYLANSFDMFRTARSQCDALFSQCVERGWTRVALMGAGDLAEIAALSGLNENVEIVAVVDESSNLSRIAGIPIARRLDEAGQVDAFILTDIRNPQAAYDRLSARVAQDRILIPTMLRVNRNRAAAEETGKALAE